ncbi:DUF2782 domain-containing protein [Methylococcus sp. EFPC2]|uniref:DUF2782 domain-containing protein n=1 Tax=Methylococcus sp. EFPC2 TaxID=2812648 RepID=UPI001967BCD7|nr:DUF2782 domain-containing protein [Methylococcus sp. EFPC2]QSA98212.1 DUF2782 domain-containing protein [Methylococcus sp. EFPC2]
MSRIIASLLLVYAAQAGAVEKSPADRLEPLPEVPDLPPQVQSGENMEPDVTIIRKGKDLIEEYRVHGHLYMVKIKPSIGPAYYLVDTDGDGNLETRRRDVEKQMQVPQWVLFSW